MLYRAIIIGLAIAAGLQLNVSATAQTAPSPKAVRPLPSTAGVLPSADPADVGRRSASGGLSQEEAAEPADSATATPRSWMFLPHLFYTPETRLAGGGVVGYYPGGGLGPRPSSVLSSLTVTARRQVIVEVAPELYLNGGALWIDARATAMEYPDAFFGIGNATLGEMEEQFTTRTFALRFQAQQAVGRGNWVGLITYIRHEDVVEVEEGGSLSLGGIAGAAGGSAIGLGIVGTHDSRDRGIRPRTGILAEASWTRFSPTLASDFGFDLVTLDARRYHRLGRGIVAVRGHTEIAHGEAPFTLLPKLGGARTLRGYREGRFRDQWLGLVEAEYRFPIGWRLGGVVFAGAGDVASGMDDVPGIGELERAFGAGLRYRLNQAGVNVRLDIARGRGDGGLYIGIGEVF